MFRTVLHWWARPIPLVATALTTVAALLAAWLVVANRPARASDDLSFVVDHTIQPSIVAVDPIEGSTAARTVGALAEPDGTVTELVLDELFVHTRDTAELDAFLGRWGGTVLDSFPADEEGQDHLVRVDVSRVDPGDLAADLLASEPHQSGQHKAGDERVLRLLALAAKEWRAGTEVVLSWVMEPASIGDGEVYESADITSDGKVKNVFDWSFMKTGGAMDIGVAAAWQLLEAKGRLTPSVRYMVADRGFNPNFDFPDDSKIRKGDWGETESQECGGNPCPYHGTDVVLAAMGTVGNEYGTAGPAGPVVSRLVAMFKGSDWWTIMRNIEDVAREEDVDVVNLSFTRDVYVGSAHTQKWTDHRMKRVRDNGALVVAAAGNNGRTVDGDRLWVPCESRFVLCVGGLNGDATISDWSNFGEGDSATSVEIYGPGCVRTILDPNKSALDFRTRQVCGTSVSSPFVGGVAALVMAADPSLSPDEVRQILNDTAHVGGLGAKVTGSQRRVNALAAVARALGVEVVAPALSIQKPTGGREFGPEDWVDLAGTATDFMGRAVTIHWTSDRDGDLADSAKTTVKPLSKGEHVITATATDSTGRSSSAQVKVKVVDTPPEVKIVSPPAGLKFTAGDNIAFVGTSMDPDTWTAVPDGDVTWEILRGGSKVYSPIGHNANLLAMAAGSYVAKLTAGGVTVERAFTVNPVPPGQSKPRATISKPAGDITRDAYNGAAQSIDFTGSGFDPDDGAVPGTRLRWVAYSETKSVVLCEGSGVPGAGGGGGGFTVAKSCANVTASLGLVSGEGPATTTWTVWLEAYDKTGLTGKDSVTVKIRFVTG